jgi:tetratricopeptide (TPR) repeat protein
MLRHRPALCAALLLLTVVTYLPLWRNDFVDFDDERYITGNPQVTQGLGGPGLRWAWTTFHGNYWQPLTWMSLQFDAHFFSTTSPSGLPAPSPVAVHAHNLFWHSASVLLLFALLDRLTGARWQSFLAAALFAVHPMHVESVAWAVERKDVLSVFFGLLALWAYARYAERPGWRRYLGVAAAFALSLLAKPMLMTLPFVLLLLDYWPLRRLSSGKPGRLVLEKIPLFVLAVGSAAITAVARQQTGALVSLSELPLSARLANALTAYGWYLAHTFYPVNLAALYPHPCRDWSVAGALTGAATLLAVSALALWQARRRPWLIVAWLWFVGALVPVIGLAQGGMQAWADRFSYWPHVGLFVGLVWGLAEIVRRWHIGPRVAGAAGAAILGCLATLTWIQVGHWRDSAAVWSKALAVSPNNPHAHANFGRGALNRGRPDIAAHHLAEAVRLCPADSEYRYALGTALLALGRLDEAAEQYQEAVRQAPRTSEAWHNLGVVRLRQGDGAGALAAFRRALELQPGAADTLAGIGRALWLLGQRQEALAAFHQALEREPNEADAWHGLGRAYLVLGEPDRAVEALTRARQCGLANVGVCNDLGVALGRRGEWFHAVTWHLTAVRAHDEGERALARMNGRVPRTGPAAQGVVLRCRLAFALHEHGDWRAAAEVYRAARLRDPGWPERFAAEAWRLATHTDAGLRDPEQAFELASQAVQGAAEPTAALLEALAVALAARGNYPEAARAARQAERLALLEGGSAHAADIRDRLSLFLHDSLVPESGP